ncbi:F-box/FBD/LRR-repeat protein-like protein [Tanacetum coccineum]
MCRQLLPPSLSSSSAKLMIMALEEYGYQRNGDLLIPVTLSGLIFSVEQEYSEMEAKRSSLDRISNIPSGIIEDIICLLPTKDAVRTSILSKKWRYGWVIVPKLVFNEEDMFAIRRVRRSSEIEELARKFKSKLLAIYQVLLLHQGPILEFDLSINSKYLLHKHPSIPSSMGSDSTCVEIDQIITHLARNNNIVKKFTLNLGYHSSYIPPLSIFSLHQLTDLYIKSCNFDYDPTFSRFGSLTSLHLGTQSISKKALLHLLSNCPVLKSFTLEIGTNGFDEKFTIGELFNCLPVIEQTIDCYYIQITWEKHSGDDDIFTIEDCSDISLGHLKEFEFKYFSEWIGEMEFVKLMLAKSPLLKKARIILGTEVTKDEGSRMCKMLLDSPRASQMADIIVEHSHEEEN